VHHMYMGHMLIEHMCISSNEAALLQHGMLRTRSQHSCTLALTVLARPL
jgi:hypothetical protein